MLLSPSTNPSSVGLGFHLEHDEGTDGYDTSFDFSAADCIESLVEEDYERIRARKNRTANAAGDRNAGGHPEGSEYDPYGAGNGTGSSIRNILPLQSRFYEYAREAFCEPQMRVSCLSRVR